MNRVSGDGWYERITRGHRSFQIRIWCAPLADGRERRRRLENSERSSEINRATCDRRADSIGLARTAGRLLRFAAIAAITFAISRSYANVLSTSATVRSNNSLIVDIQVATAGDAAQVVVTYQTPGTEPLASRPVPVSLTGLTTVTVGRLRASRTYNYRVWAINRNGEPAGTLDGTFTTGALPPALMQNIYTLRGRMTPPVVIMPQVGPPGAFQGFVGLDLQSD